MRVAGLGGQAVAQNRARRASSKPGVPTASSRATPGLFDCTRREGRPSVLSSSSALPEIDPAGHDRLAAAAYECPGDRAVDLLRHSPHQARSPEIDALSNGGLQS